MAIRFASFAFCVLFLGTLMSSDAVAATPVSQCGTFITAPGQYKVTTDILNCPGNANFFGAITVLASEVDLNLDGHSITCLRADGIPDIGILAASTSGVKITNGNISGCDVGLLLLDTSKSDVTDVTSNNNSFDPLISNGGVGIWVEAGRENKLSDNTTNGNEVIGSLVDLGSHNRISGNVSNENWGPFGIASGIAIISSNDNVVVGNETNLNQGAGLVVRDFSTRNTLRGNTALNNGDIGIGAVGRADFGTPIAAGNLLQGNTALGHPFDLAETFVDPNANPPFFVEEPCRNTWKSNTFVGGLGPTADCLN